MTNENHLPKPSPVNFKQRKFTSIREIPRDQWDAIWPPHTEGYDFYRSQEEAHLDGFEFFYLALYVDDTLALLAPLFTAHFNVGLGMSDSTRQQLERLQRHWPRLLVIKTLFCGSPTSEKGLMGIHPEFRQNADLLRALDRALIELAREHRVWMIVLKDFMSEDLNELDDLPSLGYFKTDGFPTARLAIEFGSVDEYLDRLSAGTRKDLRRKVKKTSESGRLQVEVAHDISHCIDEVFQLYMNTYSAGPMHFELLTKEYFLNFSRYMPREAVYFLFWMNDKSEQGRRLVGFNFCLQFDDRLIDKYIGMDYSVSRDLNLYFISLLNNVQWSIDHRKKIYILGAGEYSVKTRLGAELIPTRTMTKVVNPLIHWIAKRIS